MNTASELKYSNSIEKVLSEEFAEPSDEFIKFILNHGVYDGAKTQNVVEKYRPILKKTLVSFINDFVNQRLQNALNTTTTEKEDKTSTDTAQDSGVTTTIEELEGYYTTKAILSEVVSPEKISYKDTYSYFNVLYDNKVTKWICRIYIKDSCKYVVIPNDNKEEVRYDIEKMADLYKYKNELLSRLKQFM